MPNEVSSGGDYSSGTGLDGRVSAIEARLGRLESVIDEIRAEPKAITELAALHFDVAEMKGRLTNLPTSFQIVFMLTTFAVPTFVGATGRALAVLRLGSPH